jgi:lipopolysaccharide biosynthesis protein
MKLTRKLVSVLYWLLDSEKSLDDFRKNSIFKNREVILEQPLIEPLQALVVTAHVFYPEFAKQLIDSLKDLPGDSRVLATTHSQEIKNYLDVELQLSGNPGDVRLTPNTGRNFGPLLMEFSKELLKVNSFIHIHSKRSPHSPNFSQDWIDRNSKLLLSKGLLERVVSITKSNPGVGVIFADVSDLLWGINFRWGRSQGIAKKFFSSLAGFEEVNWTGRISFPAGGMFWVKTDAIKPLLVQEWSYSDFPEEADQGDGEIQHAIERLVGELPRSLGFDQAIFVQRDNRFYLNRPKNN